MKAYKKKLSNALLKEYFVCENGDLEIFTVFIGEGYGWAVIIPMLSFPKLESSESHSAQLFLVPPEPPEGRQ